MAITIPTITALPTPPQKSDSVNFPARADAFVVAQEAMATELAATITEMNKLVGGLDQATPIAAYNSGTTYNFPDVVAYTDGYSYRCVDNGVVGVTPGTDSDKWVNISGAGVPIGGSIIWDSDTMPEEGVWMKRTGTAISRITYAKWFSIYGTQFGDGDGSTTVNLPDNRGEFPRMRDEGAGVDPNASTRTDRGDGTTGDAVGTKQGDATARPNTPFSTNTDTHSHALAGYGYGTGDSGSSLGLVKVGGSAVYTFDDSHSHTITGGGDSETRGVNFNTYYIMRVM